MRSWSRSSVAAALVAVISMGFLFCPCAAEASEHSGCSKVATGIRAVSDDCCDDAARSGVVPSASTSAPPVLSITMDAPEVTLPASDYHFHGSHRFSLQAHPLVLRI